jgi:hypothetical protein
MVNYERLPFMRFQAGNTVRSNTRSVDGTARQIKTVTGISNDLLMGMWEYPGDRAAQDINHLMVVV